MGHSLPASKSRAYQPKASQTAPHQRLNPSAASQVAAQQAAVGNPALAPAATLLALQSSFGNQAVQRLLRGDHGEDTLARAGLPGSPGGGPLDGRSQAQIERARGGGARLDADVGEQVGSALGADFSGVNVHTDPRADALNRSLSARAFTTGSDIFFSRGAYQPGTSSGKQLLAHELTHVVQQSPLGCAAVSRASPAGPKGGAAPANKPSPERGQRVQTKLQNRAPLGASRAAKPNGPQAKLSVGPAGDAYEREAERVAEQFRSTARQSGSARPAPGAPETGAPAVLPEPIQRRAATIQRELAGDLEGQSAEQIVESLRSMGYQVPASGVRLSIITSTIRGLIENPKDKYDSLDGIASAAKLAKVGEGGSTVGDVPKPRTGGKTPSSEPETPFTGFSLPKKRTTSGVKTPSSEPETPFTGFSLPKKGSSSGGKENAPQEIGGATTWHQSSKAGEITAEARLEDSPDAFGQLKLSTVDFTDSGLSFVAEIASKPSLIWPKGDLVEIALQVPPASPKLGDLRIQKSANLVTLRASFTYRQLANMVGLTEALVGDKDAKRALIAAKNPQIGVLAMWRSADDKGEQHRSGGIDQKGGSGLINILTRIDKDTLKKTETFGGEGIRNIGWNESQPMQPGRPVYDAFPNLLQLNKEMATTLEAESEYMLEDKEKLSEIQEAMQRLNGMDTEERHKEYLIEKMDAVDKKVFTDTYYDLHSEGDKDNKLFPLLQNEIVFRRRHVPTDEKGTNLIAVKGRTHKGEGENSEEAIRLASQIQMRYDPSDPEQQEEIQNFLRSEGDNAFGRVVRDALRAKGVEGLLDKKFAVKKALTVRSERTKYKLWLADSTMIDFSADEAWGSTETIPEQDENKVYSFEFGVGHPGLVAGATAGSGLSEEDPKLKKLEAQKESVIKQSNIRDHLSQRNALVHRPYHVAKDLTNENLFEKSDYKQYKKLRDTIMSKLFKYSTKPVKGGNKAKLLAGKMGLM